MKKLFKFAIFIICFYSCNSNTDNKNIELQAEIDRLNQELEEEKYGAQNIFNDARAFFDNKDYINAKNKIITLKERHPDDPLISEGDKMLQIINEELLWKESSTNNDIVDIKNYLQTYPEGKYKKQANSKIKELENLVKENDYKEAVESNSSFKWNNFLEKYPNHPKRKEIEKLIIELEVDEILADGNTGTMPSFDRSSYSNSSSSNISIKNNTGCELIVRYSGARVVKIEIPDGASKAVNLSSGNYRVAASACGYNYGASEYLSGDYSSTFYIQRSYR